MFEEPFTSITVSLMQLLALVFVTPINQRPFGWEYSQADKFVYDAWDRFTAGLKYNIGAFILYSKDGVTYNYDGQSRLITSILLLHRAKGYVNPEHSSFIDGCIFLERPFGSNKLTQTQLNIKQEYKWKKFPRIQSHYVEDFKALGDCLNDIAYEHTYLQQCSDACKVFLDSIPKDRIGEFIEFFLNDTTALRKDYKSPTLAAKDMDIENNRGRHMSPFDNARNILITTNTEEQRKTSETLDCLRNITKGLETACIVYTGSIVDGRKKDFINETITRMTRKEENNEFMVLVRKVVEKWQSIHTTNVYKLLDSQYREYIWNIWIPVAVINDMTAADSIRLAKRSLYHLVKHGILSVNSLGVLNQWINAANGWIVTKTYQLPALQTVSSDTLYGLIHTKDCYPRFVARVYAEALQSDAAPIIMEETDVEHIIPQSTKAEYINRLGNLTIFESKKPKDIPGLRGNRSIKNRPYAEKKLAYALSSVTATRNIPTSFDMFERLHIEERGKTIVDYLLSVKTDL